MGYDLSNGVLKIIIHKNTMLSHIHIKKKSCFGIEKNHRMVKIMN